MHKLYHYFSEKAFIYRFTVIASPFSFRKKMRARTADKSLIRYGHYLHCVFLIRCTLSEYLDYELYGKDDTAVKQYLTMYRKHRILSRLGDRHAALTITGNKKTFNEKYKDFLHREWTDPALCSRDEFLSFIKKHGRVIFKIPDAFQGKGVRKYTYATDADALAQYDVLKKQGGFAEAVLEQHEKTAAFNPQTVNTLRISTVCCNGRVCLLGVCFKTGCGDASVDNLVRGGIGCAVDPRTGTVCSDGFDHDLNTCELHPFSQCRFRGFVIPNWEKIKETVTRAAILCEQNGDGHWIGWDVAVTPSGAALIEGNWNQGLTLIQCKQSGKADTILEFLKEENDPCEQC